MNIVEIADGLAELLELIGAAQNGPVHLMNDGRLVAVLSRGTDAQIELTAATLSTGTVTDSGRRQPTKAGSLI